MPTRRLDPYRAAAVSGGGMGELCGIRDTLLGRNIAIKVLPTDAARDGERRGRSNARHCW